MDEVCNDHTPIIITRQNAGATVVMSLADYEALEETAYLLRSPENAKRLARSIAAAESGKAAPRPLAE
jgi:antitoxin YefM